MFNFKNTLHTEISKKKLCQTRAEVLCVLKYIFNKSTMKMKRNLERNDGFGDRFHCLWIKE